ncbi:OmpA family protein [Orbus mooreae]|uniref:OmpA family protein n=1 Tax=Orbus mooreae TaxID=3074107 RepID=UPI00370D857D
MKQNLYKVGFILSIILGLSACSSVNNKWNVNNSWCKDTDEVTNTTEIVTLSTDALFKFDGASFAAILPEAKEELIKLTNTLNNSQIKIAKIIIVGHTDKLGSDDYNYRLGLARATTIKNYLINAGIETNYVVESKGKLEPITSTCDNSQSFDKVKACLQPDRRVELHIEKIK